MAIRKFVVALLVLFSAMPSLANGSRDRQNSDDAERQLEQEIREQDKKETSCECCLKCRAATKPIQGKEETMTESNGCRQCCDICGENLPLDKENPPEKLGE